MQKIRIPVIGLLALLLITSCGKKRGFEILSFKALTNAEFANPDSIVNLEADLSDAPLHGVRIPSANQCKNGKIAFEFKLKKNSTKEKLYYQLYYQNASYKYAENHEYNTENFYGSWEADTIGFKSLPDFNDEITIQDSLVIVGNPRNERIYFAENPDPPPVEEKKVLDMIEYIKTDKAWYKEAEKRGKRDKVPMEEQLRREAVYSLEQDPARHVPHNNRMWKNPRMGTYEFLLVVVSDSMLRALPESAKQISKTDSTGSFVNPFAYFKTGKAPGKGIAWLNADRRLKTKARLDLASGIYVNPGKVGGPYKKDSFSSRCGDSHAVSRKAQFEQYFHNINAAYPLENIDVVADVMDPAYTREQYEANKASNKRVKTMVSNSDCPCKTIHIDSINHALTLINPGNKEGEHKKEHVGVTSRVGFTYGKWRAKIKFPALINKDNVWNGLTNAFWLLSQGSNNTFNLRRECKHRIGYVPKGSPSNEASLALSQKRNDYSEIDFEILKESQYWPKTSYPNGKGYKTEDAAASDDITITCTNWDLCCHEPSKYATGAQTDTIDGIPFVHHRWNPWYQALTTKVPVKDKELSGSDYYYYEIDWQPDRITWRIGPEKDKMRVICIMDKNVTSIPNNQMVMVVTQEWHHQDWWPLEPFKQNLIPFPKNDIVGKILEIEVE